MIRNFLINILFFIPKSLIDFVFIFKKDIKRGYIFDSQSRILISLMPKLDLHKIKDYEIPKIRNLINKKRNAIRLSRRPKKKVITKDYFINESSGIKIREYEPYATDNENIILYFHGGGYVLNSIDTHDTTVSYFSEKLRTKVFSLAYSLSPEKKFPFATNEAIAALNWLTKNGYLMENISLCGDSAGAHLAASVVHSLAFDNKKNVNSQFLIYPMCDPGCSSESFEIFKDGYSLTKDAMIWFWDKFKNNKHDDFNDAFNLLLLDTNNKFPRTIIVTAGFDPLVDEAEKYASLLHEKGIFVKQLHYPSLFHGFASMTRLKSANKAVNDFLSEYKKML